MAAHATSSSDSSELSLPPSLFGWNLRRLMETKAAERAADDSDDDTVSRSRGQRYAPCSLPQTRRMPMYASPQHQLSSSSRGSRCDYRPQTAYAMPQGGIICTAVAYVVAHIFLRKHYRRRCDRRRPSHECGSPWPDAGEIDGAMRACHRMFVERHITQPLMLKEMLDWFPTPFEMGEVSGLLDSGPTEEIQEPPLLLSPLTQLLARVRARPSSASMVLIVTFNEHTIAILSPGKDSHGAATAHTPDGAVIRRLWVFDPLATRLKELPNDGSLCVALNAESHNEEGSEEAAKRRKSNAGDRTPQEAGVAYSGALFSDKVMNPQNGPPL